MTTEMDITTDLDILRIEQDMVTTGPDIIAPDQGHTQTDPEFLLTKAEADLTTTTDQTIITTADPGQTTLVIVREVTLVQE